MSVSLGRIWNHACVKSYNHNISMLPYILYNIYIILDAIHVIDNILTNILVYKA